MQSVTWDEQAEEHQELRHVPPSLCGFSPGQLRLHKHTHTEAPGSALTTRPQSRDLQWGPDVPDVNHLAASAVQRGAKNKRSLLL